MDFLELKKRGFKLRPTGWFLVSYLRTEDPCLYLGVTVSRRVGHAVIRNRLKRWSREILRSHPLKQGEYGYKINFVFRAQEKDFYKKLLFKDYEKILNQTLHRISANAS